MKITFSKISLIKKIKRLLKTDLITIERVNIDGKGKTVIFYRSKVKSLEINLQARDLFIKYKKMLPAPITDFYANMRR